MLWDLPGLGEALYPEAKTYYNKLELGKKFHAFLLFTRGVLTVNSQRLATRFSYARKPFLFVRTCIDIDVDNERKTKPETFDESAMTEEIRQSILKSLDLDNVSGEQIFLINNLEPKEWDFARLNDAEMLENLGSPEHACLKASAIPESLKLAGLSLKEKFENYKAGTGKGNSCLEFAYLTDCPQYYFGFLVS